MSAPAATRDRLAIPVLPEEEVDAFLSGLRERGDGTRFFRKRQFTESASLYGSGTTCRLNEPAAGRAITMAFSSSSLSIC